MERDSLVPGDIIAIGRGTVPADCLFLGGLTSNKSDRISSASSTQIEREFAGGWVATVGEASQTGESVPQSKVCVRIVLMMALHAVV